jgi:hypothetical protein
VAAALEGVMIALIAFFVIIMALVPEVVFFTAVTGFLAATVMDWMRL